MTKKHFHLARTSAAKRQERDTWRLMEWLLNTVQHTTNQAQRHLKLEKTKDP